MDTLTIIIPIISHPAFLGAAMVGFVAVFWWIVRDLI